MKNNEARDIYNNEIIHLGLGSDITAQFNNHAWKLLGRYIANNTHLKSLKICRCNLTDEQMVLLFSGLRSSISLQRLELSNNDFGVEGVRSMTAFLESSPNLSHIRFFNNFNTECFEALISALDGKPVKDLSLVECDIQDISALQTYKLPNLTHLNLNQNNIGRDGFITISNMLQHEGSTLTYLVLANSGMRDKEAEILADSLKDNTTLKELNLGGNNNITRRGCLALLKLMVDISSVESTYTSNHTLMMCFLKIEPGDDVIKQITNAWSFNRSNSNQSYPNPRHAAGRLKVIHYQLNSKRRKELCQIQGVEYSDSNIFADIEPILLPDILALIGERHGQSEFYTALIHTAPDLLSYMNRKAMINNEMERNKAHDNDLVVQIAELTRQRAALSAKNDQLSSRLALIDSGDTKQSVVEKEDKGNGGKKRQRS